MESRQLFATLSPPSAAAPAPRTRTLAIAIASVLLPGSGHFFLGERRLGLGLLLLVLLTPPAAVAVRAFTPEPYGNAAWLLGRLAVVAALFAVWDAPARVLEARGRVRSAGPRQVAWLNAMGFGFGHIRLGERAAGLTSIAIVGPTLLAAAIYAPLPVLVLAELVVLGLAAWGHRTAERIGTGRRVPTERGELDRSGSTHGRQEIPTEWPTWWAPTSGATALVWITLSLMTWHAQSEYLAAGRIDTQAVVQMEPYYRNPAYGMSLEMHATGWTFRAAPASTFVLAQHPAEATQVHLALRPRIPGWDPPARAVQREIERLAREGFSVRVLETGESTLAGRPALRARGRGVRDGAPRDFELRTMAIGHRRYVLRIEWDPEHADFARAEIAGLLANLRIEDRGEAATALAR